MCDVPFTANARSLGTRQVDKLQNITGNISARSLASGNGNALTLPLEAHRGPAADDDADLYLLAEAGPAPAIRLVSLTAAR